MKQEHSAARQGIPVLQGGEEVNPLTDERLRQLAYDDMVCTNANERAMAAELLTARARIAELETVAIEVLAAHRRIAELEAAQRPPLGYVVTFDDPNGRELAYEYRELFVDKAAALDAFETVRYNEPSRAQAYRLAEVREVQP